METGDVLLVDAIPAQPVAAGDRTEEEVAKEFEGFTERVDTLDLESTRERHPYYVRLAEAVETGARCLGRAVGAVLVRDDRVLGTGYNGTPSTVGNCDEGGCGRCRGQDTALKGRHYDICICVHAEQNVVATAARFGVPTANATIYTTVQPCFTCFKELMQAGIDAIYFLDWWEGADHPDYNWVLPQYWALIDDYLTDSAHTFKRLVLSRNDAVRRDQYREERRDEMEHRKERLSMPAAEVAID